MTVKDFTALLAASLVKRGVSREAAVENVVRLTRTLTPEDKAEIEGYSEASDFAALTDTLYELITAQDDTPDMHAQTRQIPRKELSDDTRATREINAVSASDAERTRTDMTAEKHYTEYTAVALTPRGKRIFAAIFVLTLPLTLAAAAIFFGVFALCTVTLCAVIATSFAVLAGLIIAGSLSTLVGIVYGVTQLFAFIGVGIYEIGVGIACAGITVILGVLIFHFATRIMPFILRQLFTFFSHMLHRIPILVGKFREECNRL